MQSQTTSNIFYVYVHVDPNTLMIRYVGKGKGRRAYSFSHRYGHHKNWIKSLEKQGRQPIVRMITENLSEQQSLKEEKFWIRVYKEYGHKLTNGTNGGDGVSGYKHSPETKKKIGAKSKGRKQTPEQLAKMGATKRGKVRSLETRKKIAEGQKGRKHSEEAKAKMAASAKKRKNATKPNPMP